MSGPTVDQMLNLADRAEAGLTPAEADRLRAGIRQLDAERRRLANARRSLAGQIGNTKSRGADALLRIRAVRALVDETRRHGGRAVLVSTLAAALNAPIEFPNHNQEAA
ncbi:hypothetical protein [Streptomyces hydrogenans]|uniref:hypothetical protein n=1 Tax=Streptomyces hydrogenans TaxID=1873719 RepID=UPI00381FE9DD